MAWPRVEVHFFCMDKSSCPRIIFWIVNSSGINLYVIWGRTLDELFYNQSCQCFLLSKLLPIVLKYYTCFFLNFLFVIVTISRIYSLLLICLIIFVIIVWNRILGSQPLNLFLLPFFHISLSVTTTTQLVKPVI